MRNIWTFIAIVALVLVGSAHAAMPGFSYSEMPAEEVLCLGQGCEGATHGAMPISECVAYCLKSGIEAAGTAISAFTGQFLGSFLAVFLAISTVAAYGIFKQKFRERGDFAKLFLERNLRGVILLN